MARRSKRDILLTLLETKDFDEIDWKEYKDQVAEMKDDIELLYGKRFYKKVMNRIEDRKSFLDKLLRR